MSSPTSSIGDSAETPRLHEELGSIEIEQLYQMFVDNKKMEPHHLRTVLRKFGLRFSDDQYKTLFLKVQIHLIRREKLYYGFDGPSSKLNTNRDNLCDWDEFVSLMLNGFRDDDPYNQKMSLNLPIEGTPIVRNAIHRYPIIRIRFNPTVMPVRAHKKQLI